MPSSTSERAGVSSPCISVCVLDNTTGWCKGCYRTIDEIAAWGGLEDAQKRAVLASLPARREVLERNDDAEP